MKLCLGTVQFGMDYGIKKQKKPMLDQSIKMLDYATQNGIDTIDTANAYGNAEEVVGEFLNKKTINRNNLIITSKVRPNILDDIGESKYYETIKKNFEESVKRLGIDYIDGYMFHSSRYVFNEEMLEALNRMKKEGYIKKFGVSVYYPDEAKEGIERAKLDIMQFPFSIFDQRMKKEGVFVAAEVGNTEIHTRSAFIQGLVTMKEDQVPEFLNKAKPIIIKMDQVCLKYGLNRIQLALQYVKREDIISKLVFGVDEIEQLKEDIKYFNEDIPCNILTEIECEFTNIPAEIVMPSLWVR